MWGFRLHIRLVWIKNHVTLGNFFIINGFTQLYNVYAMSKKKTINTFTDDKKSANFLAASDITSQGLQNTWQQQANSFSIHDRNKNGSLEDFTVVLEDKNVRA